MKKVVVLVMLMLVGFIVLTACGSQEPELTEIESEIVEALEEPEVVETPHIAVATVAALNVLEALGVESVVGIPTTQAPVPAVFSDLPEVGNAHTPDLEIVASLEPELFIMDAAFKEEHEDALAALDIPIFFFETYTYDAFIASIQALGEEINRSEEATALVSTLETAIVEASANRTDEGPRIMIIFGAGNEFMLETENSYLGNIASIMGATNITADFEGAMFAPRLPFSLEQIIIEDPDIILRFAHGNLEQTEALFNQLFDENEAFGQLSAVANERVYDLDPRAFGVSANLQVAEAFRILGDIFYGE